VATVPPVALIKDGLGVVIELLAALDA